MVALNAWMNGEFVGTWQVNRGAHSFSYAPSWLESEKSRPLSLSLPLTRTLEIKGEVVANYFDNLLPDNERISQWLLSMLTWPSSRWRVSAVQRLRL